jgi:hypothetical protein
MRSPSDAAPIFLLVVCLIGLGGCMPDDSGEPPSDPMNPTFTKEGTLALVGADEDTIRTIDIEFADTDAERQRGLMRRRSMDYGKGMLFLFDETSTSGMWMKNTPMPLDILFIAPDSTVINIARRTRPFSEESIEPTAPKRFVLEVRAGFADRFGIRPGTKLRWSRTD